MSYTTLISISELYPHLGNPDWAIIDARFALDDTKLGRSHYLEAHIPGAVYAHLDEDLSGPIIPGQTGRHPLPEVEVFAQTLSRWGIDATTQVVVYDAAGGTMAAARLWWMLHWLGHEAAAVLDGGWQRWQSEDRLVGSGQESRPAHQFVPRPRPELVASLVEVDAARTDPASRLFDSRTAEGYHGEGIYYDPVRGHIPGALLASRADTLDAEGLFRSPAELRTHYEQLLGDTPPERVIFYCGSGVTAAQNALGLAHAGLGEARLYPGSWSEWILDPNRPVER